jgi:transcriptional regulator with XRE-family HTH domain
VRLRLLAERRALRIVDVILIKPDLPLEVAGGNDIIVANNELTPQIDVARCPEETISDCPRSGQMGLAEIDGFLQNPAANTVSRWETGTYKPTAEDLDNLARLFKVSITVFFPNLQHDDSRIAALTSATGGLNNEDFEEVIRYAEFRKARQALEKAKRSKSKR